MQGLIKDFHFFFEYNEFDSPDAPGSYEKMDVKFLNKLNRVLPFSSFFS